METNQLLLDELSRIRDHISEDPIDAVRQLEIFVEENPSFLPGLIMLNQVYEITKQNEKHYSLVIKIAKILNPQFATIIEENDNQKKIYLLEDELCQGPNQPVYWLLLGTLYLEKNLKRRFTEETIAKLWDKIEASKTKSLEIIPEDSTADICFQIANLISPKNQYFLETIGTLYFRHSKFGNARKYLENLLEINPTHRYALKILGQIEYESGNVADVIQFYSLLRPDGLDEIKHWILLTMSFIRTNQFHAAENALDEAEEKFGEQNQLVFVRAFLHLAQNPPNFAKSYQYFRKFSDNNPEDLSGYQFAAFTANAAKMYEDAYQVASSGLDLFENDPELNYTAGLAHLNLGNFEEAEKAFRFSLEHFPLSENKKQNIQKNLGKACGMLYKFEEAERIFLEVLDNFETDSEIYYLLGWLYLRWNKPDKAIPYLETAKEKDPSNFPILEILCQALVNLRRFEDAKQALARYKLDRPRNSQILRLETHILIESGQYAEVERILMAMEQNVEKNLINSIYAYLYFKEQKFADALNHVQAILDSDPEDQIALNNRSIAFRHIGKIEAAKEDLKKIIKSAPRDFHAHNNLGQIYLHHEKLYGKAKKKFKKSLSIHPRNTGGLNGLGCTYGKLEDYEKAFSYFQKTLEVDANCGPALANITIEFFRREMYTEAFANYKKLIELYPDHPKYIFVFGSGLIEACTKIFKSIQYLPEDQGRLVTILDHLQEIKQNTNLDNKYVPSSMEITGPDTMQVYATTAKIDFLVNYAKNQVERHDWDSLQALKGIFPFIDENVDAEELQETIVGFKENCANNTFRPKKEDCLDCLQNKHGDCWMRILAVVVKNARPYPHHGHEIADVSVFSLDETNYFVIKSEPFGETKSKSKIYEQCVKLFSIEDVNVFFINPHYTTPSILHNIKIAASNTKTRAKFIPIDHKYLRQIYRQYREIESGTLK